MTQQNPDRRLDLGTLYLGIESCDPDLLLGFYADDARLSIVNTDTTQRSDTGVVYLAGSRDGE